MSKATAQALLSLVSSTAERTKGQLYHTAQETTTMVASMVQAAQELGTGSQAVETLGQQCSMANQYIQQAINLMNQIERGAGEAAARIGRI